LRLFVIVVEKFLKYVLALSHLPTTKKKNKMSRSPLLKHSLGRGEGDPNELYKKLEAKRDAQKIDRSGLKNRLEYLEELKQRQSKLRQLIYTSFFFGPLDTRDYNMSVKEYKKEFPLLNEYRKEALYLMDLVKTQISDDTIRLQDMLKQKKSRSKSRSRSSSHSKSRSSSSNSSSSSSRSRRSKSSSHSRSRSRSSSSSSSSRSRSKSSSRSRSR
jgi:hypothetical protein